MDVARRGETRDAAPFAQRRGIDGEDHPRAVHYDPSQAAVQGHRLGYVAQFHGIGAVEQFVFDRARLGVVERERGVAVLEIAFVEDEEPGGVEMQRLRFSVFPLHAGAECKEAECPSEDMSCGSLHGGSLNFGKSYVAEIASGFVRSDARSSCGFPLRRPYSRSRPVVETQRQVF